VIEDISLAKEKLKNLTEVDSKAINSMTEKQLLSFIESLNVAVSAFPMQKKELMVALKQRNYEDVFQWLGTIVGGLSQIHAKNLLRECNKQLDQNSDLSKVRHEKVKAFFDYIVPSLELFFADAHELLAELKVDEVALQAKKIQSQKRTITPAIVREKVLSLNELNSKIIEEMSDDALSEYVKVLDLFHIDFRSQKNGLLGAMKSNHHVFVMQWLTTIEETLTKLHATDLAASCREQIAANKSPGNVHQERLNVYVNYLLSSMSMLSSDIIALGLPKKLTVTKAKPKKAAQKVEFELLLSGDSEVSKKILVVNKMKIFVNSLKNALGDCGYTLVSTNSAESAAGYLQTEKADLFIVDEDIKDSHLLVKIIRASGHSAPIIFTTSNITKDKMVKFMEEGVADFIMKPISPTDVQKKVSLYLA